MIPPVLESAALYALLERVHGHIALLGLAVLLHPVITLWRRKGLTRGTRLSANIAAVFLVVQYALGWLVYPTYRKTVKPGLVQEALPYAMAFETKEHLAIMAVALTLGGVGTLHAAGRTEAGRKAARVLLLMAWLCGVAVGVMGVVIAARAHA